MLEICSGFLKFRVYLVFLVLSQSIFACLKPNNNSKVSSNSNAPQCPPRLPMTGDPDGMGIADNFACYGACGPSCKAECKTSVVAVYFQPGILCIYEVIECKSHDFCRWHDDCYRQCIEREMNVEITTLMPGTICKRSCDAYVLPNVSCGMDWSQLFKSEIKISDACWDGSWIVYSRYKSHISKAKYVTDTKQEPFIFSRALWNRDILAGLPRGMNCQQDFDCPDPNQFCDQKLKVCADMMALDSSKSTEPLVPDGLVIPDKRLAKDSACGLDYQCQSKSCVFGKCK